MRRAGALPSLTGLAEGWFPRRTITADRLPSPTALATRKRADGIRVSVALPALNEERTVGTICRSIGEGLMEDAPLVDELVVLDGGSTDATSAAARVAGATVVSVREIMPEVPWIPGKGESLWRSLRILTGDLVVWIDADISNFRAHFVTRLVAALLQDPGLAFVKGFYRRPIASAQRLLPAGGGRVTELLARPLLNCLFPELAGFLQPLAGEYAGRRDVLNRLPFFTGYSVDVALLIDLLDLVGLDALAQVDLDERVHRNRPLPDLGPMACAIARTILLRAEEWGRIKCALDYPAAPLLLPDGAGGLETVEVRELERPPIRVMPTYLAARRTRTAALAARL